MRATRLIDGRHPLKLQRVGFGGDVDDRAFLGVGGLGSMLGNFFDVLGVGGVGSMLGNFFDVLGVDPADADSAHGVSAGSPFAEHPRTAPIRFDRMPVRQVGVEQELQVCAQCGQLSTQCRHLAG